VGAAKLTALRDIKTRPAYSPALDFWKSLREAIVESAKGGTSLDEVLDEIKDSKKLHRYQLAVHAYKKWAKRNQIEWFDPPQRIWSYQDLQVRVNPELGIRLDGVPYVVKLYFKSEPLTQRRLPVVLQVMKSALEYPANMAVLDVGKSRLFTLTQDAIDMTPL